MTTVYLDRANIDRFEPLLDRDRWTELRRTLSDFSRAMRARRLWNVNSTARGGGVVELLSSLIPYDRGCDIDERWMVIEGSPSFFAFTKRLHNLLHGVPAGGLDISAEEREQYESTLRENAEAIAQEVRAGDVVLLHDPQVAGLAPALAGQGAIVIWRCHIGVDEPNDAARSAWRMLIPYLAPARALIFSRARYAW